MNLGATAHQFSGLIPCVVACFYLQFQVYAGAFLAHPMLSGEVSSTACGKHMLEEYYGSFSYTICLHARNIRISRSNGIIGLFSCKT